MSQKKKGRWEGYRPLQPRHNENWTAILLNKKRVAVPSNSCKAFPPLRLPRKTFQSADRTRCTEVADELRRAEGKLDREIPGIHDLEVEHRQGRNHGNADGLSRRPCDKCKHSERAVTKRNAWKWDSERGDEISWELVLLDSLRTFLNSFRMALQRETLP